MTQRLAQAVYELSTAKPHTPPKKAYSVDTFAIYCEGYYHALVMALRAIQVGERLWELQPMKDQTPTIVARGRPRDESREAAKRDDAPPASRWATFAAWAAVIFVLELLALMGALIWRVLS